MSRTSSGMSIQRSPLTSCLISSMGKSGAKSCGPMGCPVPGCITGAGGVLRSAWMLYHLVGMSFSVSTYLVVRSADFRAIAVSFHAPLERDWLHSGLKRTGSRSRVSTTASGSLRRGAGRVADAPAFEYDDPVGERGDRG